MSAAPHLPFVPPDPERIDHFVTLHGVSWHDYEALLAMRGDDGGLRVTYLKGELEIMAPSRYHETYKKRLARIIETWAEERGIVLEGYGSWTVKERAEERGAEADECYVVGEHDIDGLMRPDFAIEVVWTRGGLDKLEVWRGLGVREVWIWQDGALSFRALSEGRYVVVARSEILPEIDPSLVAECMAAGSQTEGLRLLRQRIRGS